MSSQTPWQTTGPFLHFGLPWKGAADLAGDSDLGSRPDLVADGHDYGIARIHSGRSSVTGERIELLGHVWDNTGAPVPDALLEIWQANAAGRYASPEDQRTELPLDDSFIGYGRCALDAHGGFHFRTIRPGRVPGPGNSLQAPHIALGIIGPGFLKRLSTRIYFAGAPDNDDDPILNLVPEARRHTLLARPEPGSSNVFRFDIRLGGKHETVFFDI
ncbi:MAG: protocatechuate 3,4-dioxygenase subunit alpha [Alphaproteobacteria bacterium]|nr:protocatechuate 3,4-dioxygenase subunit alpha [Alphaproteobacteria bacterium]